MRDIPVAERRARLGQRHRLAEAASDPVAAAASLVALHSTDPATVYLSAWARTDRFERSLLEEALYEDRSLIRLLGMRRTLFVVPVELAVVVQRGCTDGIAATERRRLSGWLDGLGEDGETMLARLEAEALAALMTRGQATTSELTADVVGFERKIPYGEGKRWSGAFSVASRVMFLLAAQGLIVRARPRGTWISSQYRWVATADWLGAPIPALDAAEARSELARRWLVAFGPASADDLKWWTGWTMGATRAALGAAGAVPVTVEGTDAFVAGGDEGPVGEPDPWVALLPALDPTVMGWKERHWYLGDHGPLLFDRSGNAGPTIWVDGRVVGGWSQLGDGSIVLRVLEPVGKETSNAIDDQAGRLEKWLDGSAVTPRWRTPMEQGLSAG